MNEPIPRNNQILRPCIPLIDTTPIDVERTQMISYTLKIRPGGANDHTYKKTVRLFSEGSVTQWIDTIRDFQEIWKQNSVNGPHDRAAIIRTILRDEPLTHFISSLEEQRENEGEEELLEMTLDMVDNAVAAVSGAIFPHRALEIQKLWMRRHLKKPATMKYRLLQAKVLKMNKSLPLFPGGNEESKFTPQEILEILEFSLPAQWRTKFDLDGYVPTDHDRRRLLKEAEAIERNQTEAKTQKVKKTNKGNNRRDPPNPPAPKEGQKNCKECGLGNHSTKECWKLHPHLKPDKFKKTVKKDPVKKTEKELNAMSRDDLLKMLKEKTSNKRKTTKTVSPKKRRKIVESSDSEASVHQMDQESDSDMSNSNNNNNNNNNNNMEERLQRYHQKLAQASKNE